ncbi:MAG TPA: plasmid partition protein ParG [Allocoleopsis sp.]
MGVLEGLLMTGDRPRDDSGKFLPTGEARDKNLIVRMTESEKQAFYAAARKAGYRPSDLVRDLIDRWMDEQQES